MKSKWFSNGVSFALLLLPAILTAGTEMTTKIPTLIEGQSATHYSWVAASMALDENGHVQHEFFLEDKIGQRIEEGSAAKQSSKEWIRELKDDECSSIGNTYLQGPTAKSPEEFVLAARRVLTGEIIAIEPGFSFSIPGSLLLVRVEERLSKEQGISDDVLVFVPWVRLAVYDAQFCQGRFLESYRMKEGDRVLVVDAGPPAGNKEQLLWAAPWEVTFEDADSGTLVPNHSLKRKLERNTGIKDSGPLWGAEVTGFDSLVDKLRKVFAQASLASSR